jgi:hypothetical protein
MFESRLRPRHREYLHEEYSDLDPDAATQVEALLRSSEPLLEVTFRS